MDCKDKNHHCCDVVKRLFDTRKEIRDNWDALLKCNIDPKDMTMENVHEVVLKEINYLFTGIEAEYD